ncbi:MAG TPA: protein tyrosine phosphatase family protein [Bdellovibrionota bacterium]|nr:protein tyrosine phosphatase family protein [Bdellovibrionota bacterium]
MIKKLCVLSITLLMISCSKKEKEMQPLAAADLPNVPNFSRVQPDLAVGGQPNQESLKVAKKAGYKTIINLRPREEWPFDEKSYVEDLGMAYVLIPIVGPESITLEKGKEFQTILNNKDSYPVFIHCGSSNRVGALFALYEFLENKADVETAIQKGKKAGLTSPALEERVRDLMKSSP